jgi:hypothetical protein
MNTINETFDDARTQWEEEQKAKAEANRLFNSAAVGRAEKAVGKSVLSRDRFAEELERLAGIYSFWHDVNDQLPAGEIHDWVNRFVIAVSRARIILTHLPRDDPSILERLIFSIGHDRRDISQVRRAIEGIQVLEASFGKFARDKFYGLDRIGSRNAAEHWLIGKALPDVYTRYFGDKFGFSREKTTGIPSGPGIRFIGEILLIMGINTPRDGKPFGPEAIEYYLRSTGH